MVLKLHFLEPPSINTLQRSMNDDLPETYLKTLPDRCALGDEGTRNIAFSLSLSAARRCAYQNFRQKAKKKMSRSLRLR